MSIDAGSGNFMPKQKLSFSAKDETWIEQCIDGVINIAYAYGLTRRSSMQDKLRNYNLFNNKINLADFDYVLNPYNLNKEQLKSFSFPASLQPYDIISQYFHLLLGEESKRVFQPLVIAINDDAVSQKQEQKKQEILQVLQGILTQSIQGEDPKEQQIPEQLQKYQNYTPKMMIESQGTHLLNHFYRKGDLDKIFNDCFKDVLLAAEEIITVSKVGTGVKTRRVNPMEIWYQLFNNSDTLDDAEKIYERNYMSLSEIIDEFYEFLTPEQIDELEEYGSISNGMSASTMDVPLAFGQFPEVSNIYAFENINQQRGIPVHRCTWKSYKKQGIWKYPDPNGELQEVIVEESFKAPKGTVVEWFWISEYWKGVKIGQNLFLHDLSGPCEQQFRSIDNLSTCKSGYIGTVYSATNTQSVSLMDRLVPWIYLYLILWYRTELAISKNLGKIALIDLSLIPSDWEFHKWIYYANSMGFGFVDSFDEQNRKVNGGGMNNSQQNRSLDLETGSYIQQHIQLLEFVEGQIQSTSGVTKQRLGEISPSELVGNTERATIQSSHITEPYFFPHENFKKRVCEAIIEVVKSCIKGNEKSFQYITDDLSTVLFSVNPEEFMNADYGVFVTNSTKDQQALQTYKQLLQSAIQNEQINLSTVVKTLNSLSMSDIEAKVVQGEAEMQAQKQQEAQAEQQSQQALQAQTLDLEKEKMDRDDQNRQLDRENKLQIAELSALGADELKGGDSGAKIITDQAKMMLEQSKLEHQKIMDQRKLDLENKKINAENTRTEMEKEHFKKSQKQEKEINNKELIHKERIERIKLRGRNQAKKK